MSSSTRYQSAALPPHRLARLSLILREANAHYRRVADSFRASLRPTHHARTRAEKIGLTLNIEKAVACPEHQVSVIPLPIIDTTPSPTISRRATRATTNATSGTQRPPAQRRSRPTLSLSIPLLARPAADAPVSCGPYSAVSISGTSPVAPAAAPTVLHLQNVPWRGPTSRFSITPNDPIFTLAPRRAPPVPSAPVIPDVPFSDDEEEDVFTPEEAQFTAEEDDQLANWQLGYPLSAAADCGSSSGSSNGSSRASSRGPETPADSEVSMYGSSAQSAKRKMDESDAEVTEKRVKYERKSWVRAPRRLL
ncbi:hypothetical protein C8J57DRAFT_1270557 [Mycena rebaudengoi]|nr:hypothetical protein C8J57DRAFT_1270557 [Mycena rebaudengoi]